MNNPYTPPLAPEGIIISDQENIIKLAKAQKIILYAILLNFATIVFRFIPSLSILVGLSGIAFLVMAIIGIVRMAVCLGKGTTSRVIYIICMFIPLVNLIMLLILNSKTNKILTNAGYKVGLMGAKI